MLGLPFLFVLPVLAILGVFGPATDVAHGRSGEVEWSAEYPSRMRFENSDRLLVHIKNRGRSTISQVRLGFDQSYMHAFAPVTFDPALETPYLVNIEKLEPDESRLVAVQVTADKYGPHRGWISVAADGTEGRIELSTFIFP